MERNDGQSVVGFSPCLLLLVLVRIITVIRHSCRVVTANPIDMHPLSCLSAPIENEPD